MKTRIKLLDVVALTEEIPQRGLFYGQVGTVVEELAPGVFEIEFCDNDGRTYATAPLNENQMMVLRYYPVEAA